MISDLRELELVSWKSEGNGKAGSRFLAISTPGTLGNPFRNNSKRDMRRAKRAAGKIGFWGSVFLPFLGNTKEIQREYAAREARRGKNRLSGYP